MSQKLIRMQESIKKNCSCEDGCHICKSKANRLTKYQEAGIPAFFWDKSFKGFGGNKIFKSKMEPYIKDLDSWYDSGKSLFLVGNLGTGKSYVSCCFLKLAIVKGYSGMYTTMMDCVNNIVHSRDSKFLDKVLNKDFLIIDEFDSRWIFPSEKSEQIFSSNMEFILRTRFQNMLPTVLCSNTSEIDNVLKGFHSKAFSSLKTKYGDVVYTAGGDLRRQNV
jgi:DNA replication protein DnaC